MTAPVIYEQPRKNAWIHGTPASLKALVRGMRPVNGRIMASYGELRRLNDRYDEVVAETRDVINRRYDAAIAPLAAEESRLRQQLEGMADKEVREPDAMRPPGSSEPGAGETMVARIRALLQRASPGNHQNEISRQLDRIRKDREQLAATRDALIRAETENLGQSFSFLRKNPDLLSRAGDEDELIGLLSGLSADYHVISDVVFPAEGPVPGKKEGEPVPGCRIDQLVVGPSGAFLLDARDRETGSGMPLEARSRLVRQAHDMLARFLRKNLDFEGEIPIRNLIITTCRSLEDPAVDNNTEIVTPAELVGSITSRKTVLSRDQLTSVVGLLTHNDG